MEYGEARRAAVEAMMYGKGKVSNVEALSKSELRKLKAEIEGLLGDASTVSQLNLEQELVDQFNKTKGLMDDVLHDDEVPANQRAQVANSVVTALTQLIKLQEDLKKQEQLKIMESCLIDALKVLPQETKDEFFVEYERLAAKAGLS